MKTWCILVLACLCAPATGQRLHLAVARANVVAIAKEIGIGVGTVQGILST